MATPSTTWTPADPIIRFESVSKQYSDRNGLVHAVRDVSLEVKAGEIFGIVGYSGAGKSTLLRLVNALERPTSGSVLVEGIDVAGLRGAPLRSLRHRIGMIFQQFNLFESRTVFGNVAYSLRLQGVPRAETASRVHELLEFVGLGDRAKAYPEQLSGGQKQRVGIARALASRPDILISDEATSALDPQTTDEVLDLLSRVNREYGITILLITHEMEVIKKICTRVAVMQDGGIVEEGSTFDVFSSPREPATKRFVSSVIQHDAAPALVERLTEGGATLVRIPVDETHGPAVSRVLREHRVDFTVRFGGVSDVAAQQFGSLLLELHGEPSDVAAAIATLTEHHGAREVS